MMGTIHRSQSDSTSLHAGRSQRAHCGLLKVMRMSEHPRLIEPGLQVLCAKTTTSAGIRV